MKRAISLLLLLTLVAAACGRAPSSTPSAPPKSTPSPTPDWSGPGKHADDGTVDVYDFNAYARGSEAEWARSPIRMALEFLALGDPSHLDGGAAITTAEERTNPEDGTLQDSTEASVLVTMEGLGDDSVQAVRYTLEFAKRGDAWQLISATWGQRCAAGRGHQDFSVELCV